MKHFRFGTTPNQYGFRTPLLVISPYVINAVDHTERSQASIVRFIESVFGLPSLGVLDSQTDDLSTMFNFSGLPRPLSRIGAPVSPARFRGAETQAPERDTDD